MDIRTIRVLVIGNDAATVATIREALEQPDNAALSIARIRSLAAGVERLGDASIDIVLLDSLLPDGCGGVRSIARRPGGGNDWHCARFSAATPRHTAASTRIHRAQHALAQAVKVALASLAPGSR